MKWLFDLLGLNATRPGDELEEAINHVVDGIEPRLRLVPGYRQKLLPALQKSLKHIDETIDRIHGPMELDHKGYFSDPEVKALFASPDEIDALLRDSNEISSFQHSTRGTAPKEAWALLCVTKQEKKILGMELAGNDVRRDVRQTAINFFDHKLMAPAANEEEVRCGIKKCIFDAMITHGLQHILELKLQRKELEDQRRILHARLRARRAIGNNLDKLIASAHTTAQSVQEIEGDLNHTEEKLQQLPASENVLGAYLEEIQRILNQPEAFIHMDTDCVRLNHMGIRVDTDTSQPASTVCYSELEIAQVLKRVVSLAHFPLDPNPGDAAPH